MFEVYLLDLQNEEVVSWHYDEYFNSSDIALLNYFLSLSRPLDQPTLMMKLMIIQGVGKWHLPLCSNQWRSQLHNR